MRCYPEKRKYSVKISNVTYKLGEKLHINVVLFYISIQLIENDGIIVI